MNFLKAHLVFSGLALLLLPSVALAEWDYATRADGIDPLKCDYRIVSAVKSSSGSVIDYYAYNGSPTFSVDVSKGKPATALLGFEVTRAAAKGLLEFVAPADKAGLSQIINLPSFGCRIAAETTRAQRTDKTWAKNGIQYTLYCSGAFDSDGTAGDVSGIFQLVTSKVNLQDDCRH